MKLPRFRVAKIAVWCLLALPLAALLNDVRIELAVPTAGLGADPEDAIVDHLGIWSLRFLWLTLVVSSFARMVEQPIVIQFRRMVGLWTFAMVALHITSYLSLLARFDVTAILGDFTERPYIIAGLVAVSALLPLAITSTRGFRRRMGRNWNHLHRLVYVAAIAAWVHLLWLERATFEESALYGVILVLLLAERIIHTIRTRRGRRADVAAT